MTSKALAALSPAETEILRLVWRCGSRRSRNVFTALPKERSVTYATVQTLLCLWRKRGT